MCRWWRALPSVPALMLSAVASASAQLDGSLDIGAALLRQNNHSEPGVLTLAGGLRATGYRAAMSLDASAARGGGYWDVSDVFRPMWTGHGTLSASVYSSALQRARWELGGTVGAFGASADLPTVSALLGIRQHYRIADGSGGVFIGAEGGQTSYDRVHRPTVVATAGGWWRDPVGMDRYAIRGSLTDTRVDAVRQDSAGWYLTTIPATYYDIVGQWQREHGRWNFTFAGGPRFGERGVDVRRFWGHGAVSFLVHPSLTLVMAGGQALPDHVRGVPEAQYFSVAARTTLRPRTVTRPGERNRAVERAPSTGDAVVRLHESNGTWRTFVVQAVGGGVRAVEVMADFTNWEAVALAPRGSGWILEGDVDSGVRRMLVRVNGGEWRVPTNLTSGADGLGGVVGLITLP